MPVGNAAITADQMNHRHAASIEAQCAWMRANNIDPEIVSARRAVVVLGDEIQYHEVLLDANGRVTLDETGPFCTEIATVLRTVSLVVPMPAEWPTCPECNQDWGAEPPLPACRTSRGSEA